MRPASGEAVCGGAAATIRSCRRLGGSRGRTVPGVLRAGLPGTDLADPALAGAALAGAAPVNAIVADLVLAGAALAGAALAGAALAGALAASAVLAGTAGAVLARAARWSGETCPGQSYGAGDAGGSGKARGPGAADGAAGAALFPANGRVPLRQLPVAGRLRQVLAGRPGCLPGRGVHGQVEARDQITPGCLFAADVPVPVSAHYPLTNSFPARFPAGAAVRPDEPQAPSEDDLGVVVQGRDVIAIRQLADFQLTGRQCLAQQREAGRPDHVIGRAPVGQHRLSQVTEVLAGDPPQARQRGRGLDRDPVVT